MTAAAAIAAARAWIGTPFVEGQAARGAGADCVGVLSALAGPDAPAGRDAAAWLAFAAARLRPIAPETAGEGDVVVFAAEPGGPARHAGLLTAPDRLLHAHWRAGVVEGRYGRWWRARAVAAFRFDEETPWRA